MMQSWARPTTNQEIKEDNVEELIGMISEHNECGKQDYDPEDALQAIRGTANMLIRMACGDNGGGWIYDAEMFMLMGNNLIEAADAIETALIGGGK